MTLLRRREILNIVKKFLLTHTDPAVKVTRPELFLNCLFFKTKHVSGNGCEWFVCHWMVISWQVVATIRQCGSGKLEVRDKR